MLGLLNEGGEGEVGASPWIRGGGRKAGGPLSRWEVLGMAAMVGLTSLIKLPLPPIRHRS
jgi:hypothetical protein